MLADQLRARFTGVTLPEIIHGTTVTGLRLGVPAAARRRSGLETVPIAMPEGWVPLSAVATIAAEPAPSQLHRRNGLLAATVRAGLIEEDAGAVQAIWSVIERDLLPRLAATHPVTYEIVGQRAAERTFLSEAVIGAAACLAGIYAAMAWVFGSWWRPLPVMVMVPFALTGVVWGHMAMGTPLSLFSVVGLIGLAGIVVNGAIVLVAAVSAHRARLARRPAIVVAARERLRPVLVTTVTTLLGLAPILTNPSVEVLFLKPAAVTLVFGLALSPALVLVLLPALLAIEGDLVRALGALRRAPTVRARWRRRAARAVSGRIPGGGRA
jgi:multidrug efflux pump subunit AcrB